MARGAWAAPATEGKTPPETSRMSIRGMSGSSRDDSNRGQADSSLACPARFRRRPSTRQSNRDETNRDDMSNERSSKPFEIKAQYTGGAR
jgi:hypothetical protein